jgi:hypothetical protein
MFLMYVLRFYETSKTVEYAWLCGVCHSLQNIRYSRDVIDRSILNLRLVLPPGMDCTGTQLYIYQVSSSRRV